MECGGKLVKELLSNLTIDERLGVMLELEDASPDKFAQLVVDALDWVDRSRIFQLQQLTDKDLYKIIEQTLFDSERGYGNLTVQIDADALAHLVNVANGDARSLLNALQLAVETTPPDATGVIHIPLAVAEESIQQRAVLYDKKGDVHFDTISAFINSLRGSDPDAALYWLAKMVYAGEDPRFIFRRMLILASEDVGLADPQAPRAGSKR
ncbi:hypothetical protein LC613_39625 [Nostoc sphaeroides CHAB 2801]|uniref:AAA family ATPase n=1 Tax=Nostoc sphaeroides TaxID=446679 RepID=UPI001E485E71|nr:hypothetical protein [Nostoc sphaeroides]MCC5633564.1 hypothetical protein [Nostoc sphaeroides CHAB 2801]